MASVRPRRRASHVVVIGARLDRSRGRGVDPSARARGCARSRTPPCRSSECSGRRSGRSSATCTRITASAWCANQRVVAIHGRDGAVDAVETTDGTRIDADLVVVGIGAAPRTALAEAAGLDGGQRDPGRRAPRVKRPRHLRRRRRRQRPAPDRRVADPRRALGQRAAPGPCRGPQRARPRRGVHAGAVLLLRPVRPQHGVRGLPARLRPGRLPRRSRERQVPRVLAAGRSRRRRHERQHLEGQRRDLGAGGIAPADRRGRSSPIRPCRSRSWPGSRPRPPRADDRPRSERDPGGATWIMPSLPPVPAEA